MNDADAPTPPVTASFRCYEERNDFLAPQHRRHEFQARCARAATGKHMIEEWDRRWRGWFLRCGREGVERRTLTFKQYAAFSAAGGQVA